MIPLNIMLKICVATATFNHLPFAYRTKRRVEEPTLPMLNTSNGIHYYRDRPGPYDRILFVDFSSAFNAIQPHFIIRKYIDIQVGTRLILFAYSFPINRSQPKTKVKVISHSVYLSPPVRLRECKDKFIGRLFFFSADHV